MCNIYDIIITFIASYAILWTTAFGLQITENNSKQIHVQY